MQDLDHDGMLTWQEWVAGSDPTNAASFLGLTADMLQSGSNFVIRWSSVTGKLYRLDRSTNLLDPASFSFNVRTNIPAEPPVNTETDTTAVGQGPYYLLPDGGGVGWEHQPGGDIATKKPRLDSRG